MYLLACSHTVLFGVNLKGLLAGSPFHAMLRIECLLIQCSTPDYLVAYVKSTKRFNLIAHRVAHSNYPQDFINNVDASLRAFDGRKPDFAKYAYVFETTAIRMLKMTQNARFFLNKKRTLMKWNHFILLLAERFPENRFTKLENYFYNTNTQMEYGDNEMAEQYLLRYCQRHSVRLVNSEQAILKNLTTSTKIFYARDVIKGEWPAIEPEIITQPSAALAYLKIFRKRLPDAEAYILKRWGKSTPELVAIYSQSLREALDEPWTEGRGFLVRQINRRRTNPKIFAAAFYHASNDCPLYTNGGRWPEFEQACFDNRKKLTDEIEWLINSVSDISTYLDKFGGEIKPEIRKFLETLRDKAA